MFSLFLLISQIYSKFHQNKKGIFRECIMFNPFSIRDDLLIYIVTSRFLLTRCPVIYMPVMKIIK